MDEDILKELFQIGLENPAAKSICIDMKEKPAISHYVAEVVTLPEVNTNCITCIKQF